MYSCCSVVKMLRQCIVLALLFITVDGGTFPNRDSEVILEPFSVTSDRGLVTGQDQLLKVEGGLYQTAPFSSNSVHDSFPVTPIFSEDGTQTLNDDTVAVESSNSEDFRMDPLGFHSTTQSSDEEYMTNTNVAARLLSPPSNYKISTNSPLIRTNERHDDSKSKSVISGESFLFTEVHMTASTPPDLSEHLVEPMYKSYSEFLNDEQESESEEGDYGQDFQNTHYKDESSSDGHQKEKSLSAEGTDCPPTLLNGSVEWQKGNRVVTAYLPHLEPSTCDPPLKCSVSTTVHRHIYLQEGDSLQVMLQRPRNLKLSNHEVKNRENGTLSLKRDNDNGDIRSNSSALVLQRLLDENHEKKGRTLSRRSIKFRDVRGKASDKFGENGEASSPKKPDENTREKRETPNGSVTTKSPTTDSGTSGIPLSPLTVWKVTEHEWSSCSTREGGQIAQSGGDGVANISDSLLPAGTQFFIGRSSWSSSECFKLKVVVRPVDCGEGSICSGKGVCYANSSMERYGCGCCAGYTGKHCEERNACRDSPCLNAGICLDIQEGHDGDTFQCLCPYGYRGRLCDTPSSLCDSNPCQNGGFCEGNHTSYYCHCPVGWTGSQCMEESSDLYDRDKLIAEEYKDNLDGADLKGGCSNGPCIHGVCVETTSQEYRCFCQPGFGGDKCELEYDECYSNPCHNSGTCVDQIGTFQCLCGPGFTGNTCMTKINLCEPDPCPTNRICLDKGNSFSCECLPELTDDDCIGHEEMCSPNPCGHGGTCYPIAETLSFYCACRPGFTGQTCQGIDHYPLRQHAVPISTDGLSFKNPKISIYRDASILESVGPYGTQEPEEELGLHHTSITNPMLRMKNLYTGAVTLACAFLIFILVVSICHCRVNGASPNCLLAIPRPSVKRLSSLTRRTSLRDKRRRDCASLRFDCDQDGASVPMTSQGSSDSVFYNMDVCDNQELPLIK